ncbi:histidine kinase [Kitasatospora arboriphila]
MPRFLAPLLRAATYARWLHLLIGTVFVGVVLLVYPGIEPGQSLLETVALSAALDAALLGLAAMLPATRRAEGVQARLLLVPDREESIGAAPSASWTDRGRTAGWLVTRTALGFAVGLATVRALDLGTRLLAAPPYGPLLLPVLVFALLWLVVLAGRLQLALAVRLLGPSAADRLAAAELRAERLLERNRLARELHDSIGHALTVTVLQVGAAREVADPAFREKALEAIETTGLAGHGGPGTDARPAPRDPRRCRRRTARTRPGARAVRRRPGRGEPRPGGGRPGARRPAAGRRLPRGLPDRPGGRHQRPQARARHADPGPGRGRRRALDLHCATALPCRGHRQGRTGRGGRGLRGVRERAVLLGGAAEAGRRDGDWVLSVSLPIRLAE